MRKGRKKRWRRGGELRQSYLFKSDYEPIETDIKNKKVIVANEKVVLLLSTALQKKSYLLNFFKFCHFGISRLEVFDEWNLTKNAH